MLRAEREDYGKRFCKSHFRWNRMWHLAEHFHRNLLLFSEAAGSEAGVAQTVEPWLRRQFQAAQKQLFGKYIYKVASMSITGSRLVRRFFLVSSPNWS